MICFCSLLSSYDDIMHMHATTIWGEHSVQPVAVVFETFINNRSMICVDIPPGTWSMGMYEYEKVRSSNYFPGIEYHPNNTENIQLQMSCSSPIVIEPVIQRPLVPSAEIFIAAFRTSFGPRHQGTNHKYQLTV